MQTPTFPDDPQDHAVTNRPRRFVASPRDYCGEDMVQIIGIPECDQDTRRQPLAWAMVFGWLIILFGTVAGFGIGYFIGRAVCGIDLQSLIDFAAPTAAQAREAGWVALAEGL